MATPLTDRYTSGLTPAVDNELIHLRAENQALVEELTQCQADKEFVWSLWKRLQVANPDLTQAIAVVLQREKEKQEAKDHKVLEILTVKDDRVEELQRNLSELSQQFSEVLLRKSELQSEVTNLKSQNASTQERLDKILGKLQIHEKDARGVSDIQSKLRMQEDEVHYLRQDKDDLRVISDTQKQRIHGLEEDLNSLGGSFDQLAKETHELKQNLRERENNVADLQSQLKYRNTELETVRRELAELWQTHTATTEHASQQADLIRQLQGLNKDTQKILKNQEDAFSMEATSLQSMYNEMTSRYQQLRSTNLEMQNSLLTYKKRLADQDNEMTKLRQLDDAHNRSAGTQASLGENKGVQSSPDESNLQERLRIVLAERDNLQQTLTDTDRQLQDMKTQTNPNLAYSSPSHAPRSLTQRRSLSSSPIRDRQASLSPRRPLSLSSSPCRGPNSELERRLKKVEQKLDDTRVFLKLKTEELDEVRRAHDKRLDRLKALQANYRLTKKQLAIVEEDLKGPVKKKKKLRPSDPRSLQKEDSDTVWNELAYYRNECKNIAVDNMNLQEERDTLRVQTAQDTATIHELKACLEQEREELLYLMDNPSPRCTPPPDLSKDLHRSQQKLRSLQNQLKNLEMDHNQLLREKTGLDEERRTLKSESNQLKRDLADRQIVITDLKGDVRKLQKQLRFRKRRKPQGPRTDLGRQYQETLNRSIRTMSDMFDEFNKDGWQEVSESDEGASDTVNSSIGTELTAESLGCSIVQAAQSQGDGTRSSPPKLPQSPNRGTSVQRQTEAVQHHVHRLSRQRGAQGAKPDADKAAMCPLGGSPEFPFPAQEELAPVRPHVVSKKSLSVNPLSRQLAACRQRIQTLQREVVILRSAKNAASKKESEQTRLVTSLQQDLNSTTLKLQTARFTIQRLNGDMERVRIEKEALEMEPQGLDNSTASSHTQQEWNGVQSRLKAATTEVSKQLTQIRQLKTENSNQAEKIVTLQEKISHMERDVSQKRLLVDDMKRRLQLSKENAQSDADVMLEVENRLRTLADTNARYKTQVESYKTQIQALQTAKLDNEDKVMQLSQEIEKKTRHASDLQRKLGQLQATVGDLELTAQQQLHALANESKAAIHAVNSKFVTTSAQLSEFHKFIKLFCHSLAANVNRSRQLLQQQQRQKQSQQIPEREDSSSATRPHISRAHQVACDILNLSQSELQDLMDGRPHQETAPKEVSKDSGDEKQDKKWKKKWEKLVNSKDFSLSLVDLLMEKMDEQNKLTAFLVTA